MYSNVWKDFNSWMLYEWLCPFVNELSPYFSTITMNNGRKGDEEKTGQLWYIIAFAEMVLNSKSQTRLNSRRRCWRSGDGPTAANTGVCLRIVSLTIWWLLLLLLLLLYFYKAKTKRHIRRHKNGGDATDWWSVRGAHYCSSR